MKATAGDGPKRRLGSGIGLSRSRQSLSNRDAVSRGEGPHNGDIVRVSGRGQFVCHGSVVMAGCRCPQGDASSRWLIVIRTDLFLPTPTMIAVQIRICAA